jgi:hypothetical protein
MIYSGIVIVEDTYIIIMLSLSIRIRCDCYDKSSFAAVVVVVDTTLPTGTDREFVIPKYIVVYSYPT